MASLAVSNLVKHYGEQVALNGVDLSIHSGEFFCVLGPSAAGKTTLLRTIAGLEPVTSGYVSIAETDVTTAPIQARDVAMIFQSFALYPHLSVRRNLAYPLKEAGMARASVSTRVEEIANQLGLTHTLDRLPSTLSGGEQQRVAIGRAIVRKPRILLLDEPLTNLDAKLRHDTRAGLKRLHRELGITMIYATPDQLEALSMGERIAILNAGKVQQVGTPDELYDVPNDQFVAGLVGSPAMNMVEGKVRSGAKRALATPFGELHDGPWTDALAPLADDTSVMLGVRPQDIALVDAQPQTAHAGVEQRATLRQLEPLGDLTVLDMDVAGAPIKMVLSEGRAASMRPGDALTIAIDIQQTHLFSKESGAALR